MSICICPEVGIDGMYDPKQVQFVADFLKGLAADGRYADADWSLLSLAELHQQVEVTEMVPFRGGPCYRTRKCCGECVRPCATRCIQDCLHRLYLWKQLVVNTPESEQSKIPLAIRLIVNQKFESHQQLAKCVGEIISGSTNTELAKYMSEQNVSAGAHPYRNDYGPSVVLDLTTGKRKVNPDTGEIAYRYWPESGLCPYCYPSTVIDGNVLRRHRKK